MEENNVSVVNEETPKKRDIGASIKEWIRKKVVALKRNTNVIPLLMFLITSLVYLLSLGSFSQTGLKVYGGGDSLGFPVFVNCLLSILIVVLHLNAFPKRSKKVNLPNYILVYVFAAAMLAMDILYYIKVCAVVAKDSKVLATAAAVVQTSAAISIVHVVLLGVSVLALATLPLYSKLIMKINTSKEVEASQLNEVIDTEEE